MLEPFGNITNAIMGWRCLIRGDYNLTDAYCRKAIGMEPDSFLPHLLLGWVRVAESGIEEAIALINRSTRLPGTDYGYDTPVLAAAYASSGRHEKIVRLREDLARKSEDAFVRAGVFALLAMIMGDLDQTFKWPDKAYEERDSNLVILNCYPAFRPIRSDLRFQAFLRRMKFPAIN
ncbi:MAG: hypothetical protein JXR49_05465 [Acidobacteria bacterium]|nr:hypothetical protein [Acidobacteriota bacterium]